MKLQNEYTLEKLRGIFATAPCGVGIFTAQNQTALYYNDAYYKLTGYTLEEYAELIGRDYQKLVFADDQHIQESIADSVASSGGVTAVEYRIEQKDKSIRWVCLSNTEIKVDGEDCSLCFFEDITPEKDSFEQLRLVTESIGDSISVLLLSKGSQELLYANNTYFKWVGADRDNYGSDILKYNMSFVVKEDLKGMEDAVQKSVLTGEPQELEYRFVRPGESMRWMSRRLTAVQQGESCLVVSIVTDITEKKELQEKLDFERKRYQDVVDNMPSGFVKICLKQDGSAQPLFVNQTFCNMIGMSIDECMQVYSEDSFAGVHPDDLARMHEIADGFRIGNISSYTIRLKKNKSDWVWGRITTAVREENGETMLYNSYEDVSAEQENRFMMDRLLNEMPGGVAIFKVAKKTECIYFNDGFAALSNRSRQELEEVLRTHDIFEKVILPSDGQTVTDEIKLRAVNGEPINITFRYLIKTGEIKWIHLNASKLREEDGCPVYHCVFTEPSRLNMLYQSIAEESSVGILVSDEKTHEIYYTNHMLRQLMHISDEQCIGEKCYEYIFGKENACEDCISRNVSGGETKESIRHFPKLGIYVRVRSTLVNWLGRPALVEYATDVTENYQKQLQQQELLNSVPSGFGIFEVNHGVIQQTYMNDYYYHMIGETRESRELKVKTNVLDVVHPDDWQAISNIIDKLVGGDNSGYVDHRVMCQNGEYRWFRLMASVVNRESDNLTVYCSYTDLNETIKAQRELEQAYEIIQKQYELEQEQRKLLERDSIAAYRYNITKDQLTDYHTQQQGVLKVTTGSDNVAMLKKLNGSLPMKLDQQKIAEFYNNKNNLALFQKGVTEHSVEYRIRQEDGRLHWRKATACFSRDAFSDDIVSYTYISDIDLEKRRELASEVLVEEETDYVILLNAYEDVCSLLRLKGTFREHDDWKVGEEADFSVLVQPDRMESILPEDRNSIIHFFNRSALVEGLETQDVITVTFRQIVEDGEIRRKKIRAFYLDETQEDIIIARRDITDLYEEEQEQKNILQNALNKATAANNAKTTFLSNMSHEIRTPINAIIGMTELALDDVISPAVKENLESIQNSSQYLLNIINDILDMSRIESGKFTLDPQWVSPLAVLNPCIEMIRPIAEAKHINFITLA